MKTTTVILYLVSLLLSIPAVCAELKIDFTQAGGPVEAGYEGYFASHEVPATFTAQSYRAFGTVITVRPNWAPGATAAAMQMIDRGGDDGTDAPNLLRDWIGTDNRQPGNPMTLTISGLPAGTYTWLSYHHDPQDQTGPFDVTVIDAAGSSTTTDIDISSTVNDGGVAQDANSYTPAQRLDFGKTYYWRVDEVNAPPTSHIEFKGQVWSFTTELYAYPIENITATASSAEIGKGPENTMNGSGLDDSGAHSTATSAMWLSVSGGPQPTWIEYEFDKEYKLHQMHVWNYNGEGLLTVYGLNNVTIEYSTNGTDYIRLATTDKFEKALGQPTYVANTVVDFDGVVAKFVKITANSNYSGGMADQYGLSEVRFFYIPVWAREPNPDSGATGVGVDNATVSWRAGREAASHKVYFSASRRAVIDETISPVSIPANGSYGSYNVGALNLGRTHYWKVNEVNEAETPTTWKGDIWSFAVLDYFVVDDMETYGSADIRGQPGSRIWYTWNDGYGWTTPAPGNHGNNTGAIVDVNTATATVLGGRQSLRIDYDNDGTFFNVFGQASSPSYSEAKRTFDTPQDWTKYGIKSLTLWFYGGPNNSATEKMYVKLNDSKVTYDGDSDNLTLRRWWQWNIDLKDFAGANLSNVTQLSIGFERSGGAGGSGVVYFDDIRLYPARCLAEVRQPEADLNDDCVVDYLDLQIIGNQWLTAGHLVTPVSPGSAGLVAHWAFDDGSGTTAQDSSGKNNHGTVMGGARWVASGKVGGALAFDGVDDIVEVEQNSGLPIYNNGTDNTYSVAMWVKGGPQNDRRVFSEGSTTSNNPLFNMGTHNSANPTGQFAPYIRPDTGTTLNHPLSQAEPFDQTWHHIAWVDENGTARLYVDGELDGGNFNYTRGTMALNTTSIGGIRRAAPSHFFTGHIDDVYVYNRALSQPEIAWLVGHTSPFSEPFDLNVDGAVDFSDYAALCDAWLDEQLWP